MSKKVELLDGMIANLIHQSRQLDELINDESIHMTRGRWNTLEQVQYILHNLITLCESDGA